MGGERPGADRAQDEVKRQEARKREKIPRTGRENPTGSAAFLLSEIVPEGWWSAGFRKSPPKSGTPKEIFNDRQYVG
jgi:hypothetical protein